MYPVFPIFSDLAMVLADPHALHTCCGTLLKLLHGSVSGELLPRVSNSNQTRFTTFAPTGYSSILILAAFCSISQDNPDFVLLLRLINLGLSSWTMMDKASFKESKVRVCSVV